MAMRVLIFEPYNVGHRLHYVRTMLPALTELGCRVTITLSSETPSLPEYRTHLQPDAESFESDPWLPPRAPVKSLPGLLRESVRRAGPEALLVPTADGLAQLLGFTRGLRRRAIP